VVPALGVAPCAGLRHHSRAVPTYDYQCRSCGNVTEVIHSMLEDGPTTCERCGGALRRILYPTGIIFKGSGFYSTDSRSGSKAKGDATPSPSAASSDGKSDASKKTDASGTPPKSAPAGEAG
jgi:putative FmdB family regulatory protein